jgi:hypothetical protein
MSSLQIENHEAVIARSALERLYPTPNPYASDPVRWAQQKLGLYLWSKQKEILESVRDNMYTAVQSAHGTGKSFSASIAGSWWLDSHELGQAFLISTAPSWAQVQAILWREMRRRHREGGLPGRITLDCHWHGGYSGKQGGSDEELIGMGRKPQDYDENTFQGIHARYFMALLDEAGGIDEWLWDAVLSLATNENSRILAIGNPDDPGTRFAKICKPGSGWNVIKVSAFDVPAFTGESVPDELHEVLTSEQWVNDRRRDWGEGSPIWTAKVLGEFPDVSDEYLISPSLFKIAHQLDLPGFEKGRYGVDIARMGQDRSVVYRNRGGHIRLAKWWAKKDTSESTKELRSILMKHATKQVPVTMDMVGVGAGPYDNLRAERFEIAGFNGAERAFNPKRFFNRRAEAYWNFREMMEDGLIDLDPADEILEAQLGSIKWFMNSREQIQIETKEDMRERGLPSPDHADAAVLSTVSMGSVREAAGRSQRSSLTGDLMQRAI